MFVISRNAVVKISIQEMAVDFQNVLRDQHITRRSSIVPKIYCGMPKYKDMTL